MSTKNGSFVFRLFNALALLTLLVSAPGVTPAHAGGGTVRYAKPTASGTDDCLSWANACTLQTALTSAATDSNIWVMAGTHKPTTGFSRTATFQLKNGVQVYGGFAGTETNLSQRDPAANVTTLSGFLLGITGNSYHVVTGVTGAYLDGFTITAGNADGASPNDRGGGMYNPDGSSPTLANLIFLENSASYGGGMYNDFASPTLTNVTFSGNSAAVDGGGMYNSSSFSRPVLIDVTFNGNSATGSGGGIKNTSGSNPTLGNITFSANSAQYGGGMSNSSSSSPTLSNVTFSGNTASFGGGMSNANGSNPTLTNVTFSANTATSHGGGMWNYESSNPQIRNTIFWGNTAANAGLQIFNFNSTPSVSDSVVESGCPTGSTCTNIITTDPLLGTLGDYGGLTQTILLQAGSSAIDATSSNCPATDQRGVIRSTPNCDIGAYEQYTGTYYTKPAASGLGNCQSWANACTLRNALTTTISGNNIWVMAGTHKPTTGLSRTATFQLKNGVQVYGGFAGMETDLSQRDPAANVTTLSGFLLGITGNSYHVVTGATGATLDGFTIRSGNANGASPNDRGGGMYNNSSSPTLANIIFKNNSATYGGGMYNNSSSPILTNVTFSDNSADYGGGMDNENTSSPTLTNVTFSGNSVTSDGGGMFNSSSNPVLTNATFSGNSAADYGGGMFNSVSSPTLTNVTFSGNWATNADGGGMYNYSSSPSLTSVTFSGNSATQGGGMENYSGSSPTLTNVTFNSNSATNDGGGMHNSSSNPEIRNTIFWGNTATSGAQISNSSSTPVVSDSVVQDGCPTGSTCTTIITTDPLLGALGDYGGSTQTIPLLAGSSAIDTGNDAVCPATDQRGVTRPQGAHCDIGAFELNVYNLFLPLILR
jgi:predicted outer membrane repeat protein